MEGLLTKALEIDAAVAEAHACLGFLYGGFLWDWHKAESAFEEHCGGLAWVRYDPVWDSLRAEPRFHALLNRMHLDPGRRPDPS